MNTIAVSTEYINVPTDLTSVFDGSGGQLTCRPIQVNPNNFRFAILLTLPATNVSMEIYRGRSKFLQHPELFILTAKVSREKPKQLILLVNVVFEKMYELLSQGQHIPFRKEIIRNLVSKNETRNIECSKFQTLSLKQFLRNNQSPSPPVPIETIDDKDKNGTLTDSQISAKRWIQYTTRRNTTNEIKFINKYAYAELVKDKLYFDIYERCFSPTNADKENDVVSVQLRGGCFFADHGFGKTRIMASIDPVNKEEPILIICPSHTCEHWANEIRSMRGNDVSVSIISNKKQYDRISKTYNSFLKGGYYIVASQFIDNYHYQKDIHDFIYGYRTSSTTNPTYTLYNDYYNSDYCLYKLMRKEKSFYKDNIKFFAFHAIKWGMVIIDEAQLCTPSTVDFVKMIEVSTIWCLSAKPFTTQNCYDKYISMLLKNHVADYKYVYKHDFIHQFLTKFCTYCRFTELDQPHISKSTIYVDYEENEMSLHNSIIERYDGIMYTYSEICTFPYFYFERLLRDAHARNVHYDIEDLEQAITLKSESSNAPNSKYLQQSLVSLKTDFTEQECLICKQNMHYDMTLLICGHFFCITCYESWYQRHQQCPICRHAIDSSTKFFLLYQGLGGTNTLVLTYGSKLLKISENLRQKMFCEKERVLVYSRSDKVITKLMKLLFQLKIPSTRFHGNTSVKMKSLKYFQSNVSCLLLSSSAGIDGLDLSMVNVVIFVDGHSAFQNEIDKISEENLFFEKMYNVTQKHKVIRSYRYLVNTVSDREFYYD